MFAPMNFAVPNAMAVDAEYMPVANVAFDMAPAP